ncbi:flagellar basal body P-ring biosynthesis protein [Paenibacillus albiflavus]|uniref:Flagellar basal body P-ring biosynthesis protein n=1 Tax=Paenibacillus albiflavus TaxID=2545760 RepID=A0A4R4EC25_9BACL|nr:SAF domain-containing protein [Paenibacillus albiflavus]TCZ77239.1 flagellar basal body P-ring biosynthesis protein [Paenibacillus albiflavus]
MAVIRQRTKNLIMAGSIGALFMLVVSSGAVFWGYQELQKSHEEAITAYEHKVQEAEQLLLEQQRDKQKVYVLRHNIPAGTVISDDALVMQELPKDILPLNVVDKRDAIGKVTKIDLAQNTPLIQSMLFVNGATPHDLRNNEFKLITLPSKLKTGDFADIRIKFPTGHDYIVLTKKKVMDLNLDTIWLEMDEEEILTMSSAIVDAYLEQATIYALSYVDPYMQNEAITTYPVSSTVLELIQADPNIVHIARTVLEKKHRELLEKRLSELGDADKMTYTSKQSASTPSIQNRPIVANESSSPTQLPISNEQTPSNVHEDQAQIFNLDSNNGQ